MLREQLSKRWLSWSRFCSLTYSWIIDIWWESFWVHSSLCLRSKVDQLFTVFILTMDEWNLMYHALWFYECFFVLGTQVFMLAFFIVFWFDMKIFIKYTCSDWLWLMHIFSPKIFPEHWKERLSLFFTFIPFSC